MSICGHPSAQCLRQLSWVIQLVSEGGSDQGCIGWLPTCKWRSTKEYLQQGGADTKLYTVQALNITLPTASQVGYSRGHTQARVLTDTCCVVQTCKLQPTKDLTARQP